MSNDYKKEQAGGEPEGAAAAEGRAEELRYQSKKQVVKSGVLGAFIGLAVIVPGVSGSAAAILFGLYEKLLYALGNLFRAFGRCFRFLLPIGVGGLLGLAAGFFGVRALLYLMPFALISLFAGLMLGAFPAVGDQLKGERLTPGRAALFVLGLILPVALSALSMFADAGPASLEDLQVWHYLLFPVLGYAVAVTQLVPGLSATALLMMAGWFSPLLDSVSLTYWQSHPQIFVVYVCLIAGFAAGLLTFSKGLSRLIERRRAPVFYTVAGLSLGSVATMFFNPEIMAVYQSWTGIPWAELGCGLVLMIAGGVISWLFVRFERGAKGETCPPEPKGQQGKRIL